MRRSNAVEARWRAPLEGCGCAWLLWWVLALPAVRSCSDRTAAAGWLALALLGLQTVLRWRGTYGRATASATGLHLVTGVCSRRWTWDQLTVSESAAGMWLEVAGRRHLVPRQADGFVVFLTRVRQETTADDEDEAPVDAWYRAIETWLGVEPGKSLERTWAVEREGSAVTFNDRFVSHLRADGAGLRVECYGQVDFIPWQHVIGFQRQARAHVITAVEGRLRCGEGQAATRELVQALRRVIEHFQQGDRMPRLATVPDGALSPASQTVDAERGLSRPD